MARFRSLRPPEEEPDRPVDHSGEDRIDSWIAIADYLRRDVKTVQRWERNSGMPVHRLSAGRGRPTVYAYRHELDQWLQARTRSEAKAASKAPVEEPPAEKSPPQETPERVSKPAGLWLPLAALAAAAWLIWARGGAAPETPRSPPPAEQTSTYDVGHEDYAAISPDGRSIAYVWDGEEGSGGGDVYVQEIGTEVRRRLTRTPEKELGPEWSPDGTRIAFRRVAPGSCEIVILSVAEGTARSILTREKCGGLDHVSWSPDGRRLAFADLVNRRVTISLYSLEDGSLTAVAEPSVIPRTPVDQHPSFGPDGERLVVTRIQDGDLRAIILGLDGRELQSFVTKANSRHVWSADGRSLIFSRRRTHAGELQRISLEDGTISNLPFGSIESLRPTVRGDRLAYTRWRYVTGLRRVDLRDGKVVPRSERQLVSSTAVDHSPVYSPDGTRIAFVSDRSGTEEIWTCSADGSALSRLTSLNVQGTGSPQWSPDGDWIAFDSSGDAGHDTAIFVVSSLEGKPRPLTSGNPLTRVPSWSRDGRWIYFDSRTTVPPRIWKARAEGGDPVAVTTVPGFEPRESPDGRTLYFAPGVEKSGIWAKDLETGREAPVEALVEAGFHRYWSIAGGGLYFVAGDGDARSGGPFEIKRYDLSDGPEHPAVCPYMPLGLGPSRW